VFLADHFHNQPAPLIFSLTLFRSSLTIFVQWQTKFSVLLMANAFKRLSVLTFSEKLRGLASIGMNLSKMTHFLMPGATT